MIINKKDTMSWLLCHVMTEVGVSKFGDFNSEELDVRLLVNGIETDVIEAVENMESQLADIETRAYKRGYEQAKRDMVDKFWSCMDD